MLYPNSSFYQCGPTGVQEGVVSSAFISLLSSLKKQCGRITEPMPQTGWSLLGLNVDSLANESYYTHVG